MILSGNQIQTPIRSQLERLRLYSRHPQLSDPYLVLLIDCLFRLIHQNILMPRLQQSDQDLHLPQRLKPAQYQEPHS